MEQYETQPGLSARAIDLETVSDETAADLLLMLNLTREAAGNTHAPKIQLSQYSDGVRLGRDGGFIGFFEDEQTMEHPVAMTHVTEVPQHLEIDALARLPTSRRRHFGAEALRSTLRLFPAAATAGLYTPPKYMSFYQSEGFSPNHDVNRELQQYDVKYIRMKKHLHPDDVANHAPDQYT